MLLWMLEFGAWCFSPVMVTHHVSLITPTHIAQHPISPHSCESRYVTIFETFFHETEPSNSPIFPPEAPNWTGVAPLAPGFEASPPLRMGPFFPCGTNVS